MFSFSLSWSWRALCLFGAIFLFSALLFGAPASSYAVSALSHGLDISGVDVDGDGTLEIGVLRTELGDQNYYVYDEIRGTAHGYELSADLWNIPDSNLNEASTGIDIDSDGVDEVAVLRRDELGGYDLFVYDAPVDGDYMSPLVAGDRWEAPAGVVIDIAGVDHDGDGFKDDLAVLRRIHSSLYYLSVYDVPNNAIAASSLLGVHYLQLGSGETALSLAGINPNGSGDILAVLQENDGDQDVITYSMPGAGGSIVLGGDYWNIPDGNNVLDIDRMNIDGDATDELGVLRVDGLSDVNFYVYTAPNGIGAQFLVAKDLWNIPDYFSERYKTISHPEAGAGKHVVVNLDEQRLYAYENGQLVHSVLISSGTSRFPTPKGEFQVLEKIPVKRYKWYYGPGNPNNYDLPNVHHNLRFHGPYYFHSAYWHENFGHPMSHGCINLDEPDAEWLYDWANTATTIKIY